MWIPYEATYPPMLNLSLFLSETLGLHLFGSSDFSMLAELPAMRNPRSVGWFLHYSGSL